MGCGVEVGSLVRGQGWGVHRGKERGRRYIGGGG